MSGPTPSVGVCVCVCVVYVIALAQQCEADSNTLCMTHTLGPFISLDFFSIPYGYVCHVRLCLTTLTDSKMILSGSFVM